MKILRLNVAGFTLILWFIFSGFIDFCQRPLTFPSSRDKIVAVSMVLTCVALSVGWGRGLGTSECGRIKVPFLKIGGVILIFFFSRLY